ncbi:hypothetical protein HR060_12940 [Catenovulum sp. SM1970]|uniref:hypothetical protein n=1 Tax=Marinifaba aquimaris TaxID=2741323 RepID=UPI0015741E8A|nr:hypothetical protein [Marinifaba aquimaris]NTS77764.1 hypothetical protein [Marinifaba aquimaris]
MLNTKAFMSVFWLLSALVLFVSMKWVGLALFGILVLSVNVLRDISDDVETEIGNMNYSARP